VLTPYFLGNNDSNKILLFQVNLRLILVSGKTKDFLFKPNDSAGEIAQFVFDNWPVGKNQKFVLAKLWGRFLASHPMTLFPRMNKIFILKCFAVFTFVFALAERSSAQDRELRS